MVSASSSPKIRGKSSHAYARRTGASSAVDTDAFSAGSGSESKTRSKTKTRKSKGTEDVIQHSNFQPGMDSAGQSTSPSTSLSNAAELTVPVTTTEVVSSRTPMTATTAISTSISTAATSNIEDNSTFTKEATTNAIYETADDGEFISTDRRRRRKAKGIKGSAGSNSSDSLIKTKTSPSMDQKSTSPNVDTTSQQADLPPPVVHSTKSNPDVTISRSAPQESFALQKQTGDRVQRQNKSKTHSVGNVSTLPKSTAMSNDKDGLLRPPPNNAFVHPLHALNSTSSIPQSVAPNGKQTPSSNLIQTTTSTDTREISAANSSPEQTEPSIWYSPFQSGLDISIESDREQGKHGSRPLSKPRIQTSTVGTQGKPYLPPSSFFQSSPRTPWIMPFSPAFNNNAPEPEDWSIRTRPSSVAAPMTPLLETDCLDHTDYFGGSRSANSSRRGSVENNLTESLLSGRIRMFPPTMSSVSSGSNSVIMSEGSYLSPHFSSAIVPPVLNSVNSPTHGQSPLGSPTMTANNTSDAVADTASTFVNPWDPNFSYSSNHTSVETFLPLSASYSLGRVSDRDRQSSLLRLMNGDGGVGATSHDDEKEAILRGFLLPDLTQHAHAPLTSTEGSNFQPFASVEMSLAAVVNQPSQPTGDHKYDTTELGMPDPVRMQLPLEESSPTTSTRQESSEKKPRYRHGRTNSGHHKSSSLGSFFTPFPSASETFDGSTLGAQASTSVVQDPLNRSAQASAESSRSYGNHGHGNTQPRQSRHQGSSRETDGASSTTGRRRAGTDHETRYKGASKNDFQQDSGKSRRTSKKEQHF
ncbi:hypothetical protein BGZ80_000017 [Entomortierella chlamydospora]|uniref:Uncharacterized protein n=1 Tax=Entomortierella chlamydospora TaxID=101097 RepID=A0A9P6T5X8_9FUNG|nr:hypothetical protein BGZ80_000017 [Entomortierella chlamydospora]